MKKTEKTYPILEGLLDVFGNWLRHRRELRELHQLYCGTNRADLRVTPADLDAWSRTLAADEIARVTEGSRHRPRGCLRDRSRQCCATSGSAPNATGRLSATTMSRSGWIPEITKTTASTLQRCKRSAAAWRATRDDTEFDRVAVPRILRPSARRSPMLPPALYTTQPSTTRSAPSPSAAFGGWSAAGRPDGARGQRIRKRQGRGDLGEGPPHRGRSDPRDHGAPGKPGEPGQGGQYRLSGRAQALDPDGRRAEARGGPHAAARPQERHGGSRPSCSRRTSRTAAAGLMAVRVPP